MDYGVGNLKSVFNAVSYLDGNAIVSSNASELLNCKSLILPGVGAFPHALKALKSAGLEHVVGDTVAAQKPLLGICVGMQLLTEFSMEFEKTEGLSILAGSVESLQKFSTNKNIRVPNVGWSRLKRTATLNSMTDCLLENIPKEAKFYFIHSFGVAANVASSTATSQFGPLRFASIIASGNVAGTQFHPEKSGPAGLALLKNFLSQ